MTLSKKTKKELFAEVKKLQQKVKLLSQSSTSSIKKAISKTEKLWSSLFKHSANTVAIIDKKLIIIDVNKSDRKGAIGRKAYYSVTGKSKTIVKKAIENVFKTAKAQEYTVASSAVPGKLIYVSCKATPIIENGKVVNVVVEATDITKEVEAQNSLKQSERKFKKLSDSAFEGIVIHQAGRVMIVNKALSKIFNYPEKELIGQPIFKFIHKDYHEFAIEKLKNRDENPYEMIMLQKGNKPFWAKLMAREIIHQGAPARVVAIRDISANKEAEKKLKESEERFKILSNATFEGIVFSEYGKIIDANDQFLKMYGYKSIREVVGKNIISDFIVPKQQYEAKRLIRLPTSGLFEVQTTRKDGSIISVVSKGQNIPYFGRTIRATVVYNISERKQYEIDLRESERTLSTLMNNLPGMAYRCMNDENWTMLFVSNGCIELTGYSPKALINNNQKSFASIVHPEDRNVGKKEIKEALKNKKPFEIQYRIITSKEKIKWISEKGEGVFSEKGELLFIEGFITDISEKKENELEIIRSRRNYKSLVDYSPDGVIIHVDGKIKFANPSALKIIGARKFKEVESVSGFDFILPEYHQELKNRLERARAGEELDFIEIKIKNKKGEIKEIETQPIPIKYNGMDAMQVVFHDISAKKQLYKEQLRSQVAEETNQKLQKEIAERIKIEGRMQTQTAKLNAIIENSSHIIWTVDKNLCLTLFNKNYKEQVKYLFGTEVKIGLPLASEKSTQEYSNLWKEKYEAALKGRNQYFETKINDRNDNVIWKEIFLNPIFDENKNVVEISGMGLDITGKKQAEAKITQSLQEKDVLLKEVHHRVKNNLQVISSILNLQSSYVKDKKTLDILKESQNRIKSMAFIHESLYQTKDFSSINFSEYITSLVHNLIHSYSNIDHEIKLNLDIPLIFLNLDLAIPCGLIINEIISNTLKYAFEDDSEDAEITIKLISEGEKIKLIIGDNGTGLPKHINYKNTESLGLQLVVTLTEQINGTIDIDTKKGTVYTILFNQSQINKK